MLDIILVLLAAAVGTFLIWVVLYRRLDDMRGLLLAHSPQDLLLFCCGAVCLIGIAMLSFSRRVSGAMWFCSILAVDVSSTWSHLFDSAGFHSPGDGHLALSAFLATLALGIFLRFIYVPSLRITRQT